MPLVKMVRPHVAIITTVEPVHLEFFAGIEAIADAKAEIFAGVEPGGAVVLNRDNSQFARLQRRAKKLGISAHRLVRRRHRNPRRGCSMCRCMRPVRRCMPIFSAMTSPTSSACPAVTWR